MGYILLWSLLLSNCFRHSSFQGGHRDEMLMGPLFRSLLSDTTDKNSSLLSKGALSYALYIHQYSNWHKYLSS